MYIGPPIDDPETFARLPAELRGLLERANGYVAFHGGLHVRGACHAPDWHSLRTVWDGHRALHRLYPTVRHDDIPFAEDALGDQYLVHHEEVHRLNAETGAIRALGIGLVEFDQRVRLDPVEFLSLQPLETFRSSGGRLEAGQLLDVVPPFVLKTDAPRSYRPIPALERICALAEFARQIRELPDGAQVKLVPEGV